MNLLVVFTGGTIGSSAGEDGYFSPDQQKGYRLLELYRNKCNTKDIRFDVVKPYTTLSENLNGEHLNKLINCIREASAQRYDGIIVTHGTDTLQYASSALGYALGNFSIPVVLVSSNYILEDVRSNGLANFCGAVDFIREKQGTGVFVAYKNEGEEVTIHRGTRLSFHPPYEDNLYSIENQYYGKYVNGKFEPNLFYHERPDEISCLCESWGQNRSPVLWIAPYPGIHWPSLDQQCKAVLFGSYHSGTLGTENQAWVEFVQEAKKKDIPLFLTGAVGGASYESTKPFEMHGIQVLPKASPIAMYVKLAMAVSEGSDLQEIMCRSLGGDLL